MNANKLCYFPWKHIKCHIAKAVNFRRSYISGSRHIRSVYRTRQDELLLQRGPRGHFQTSERLVWQRHLKSIPCTEVCMGNNMSRLVVVSDVEWSVNILWITNQRITRLCVYHLMYAIRNVIFIYYYLEKSNKWLNFLIHEIFSSGLCIKKCMKNPVDCCRGPAAFLMAF